MQTVNQATEIVSYVTGTQRGRARQIARSLIDAGILPKSTGRDIKKITAKEMLPLFAAISMAEKVADAPSIAREIASLPIPEAILADPSLGPVLHGLNDFSDLFAQIMDPTRIWVHASIEFGRMASGYMATIKGEVVNEAVGISIECELPFYRDPDMGHFWKTSFEVMKEGIDVMRNLFVRDDVEGVVFKLGVQ